MDIENVEPLGNAIMLYFPGYRVNRIVCCKVSKVGRKLLGCCLNKELKLSCHDMGGYIVSIKVSSL